MKFVLFATLFCTGIFLSAQEDSEESNATREPEDHKTNYEKIIDRIEREMYGYEK